MKNAFRRVQIIFLSAVVLFQLFYFFAPTKAFAQVPDVIDTTKPASASLPVYNSGVDQSIKDYLCTPTGTGTDLFDCVNRLYRFGISAGAIMMVFFLVYAGYLYIISGEAGKTKAKSVLISTLTGMAIMLGSYMLLSFINPNLVQIKTIQPPIFSDVGLPSCEAIGFGDKCIIRGGPSDGQVYNPPITASGCKNVESGGCNKQTISACPAMAAQMDNALKACNQESAGGNSAIPSSTDKCTEETTGKVVSFSWGLWQINITNSYSPEFPECQNVLTPTNKWGKCLSGTCGRTCKFGRGEAAFTACTKAVSNPSRNTRQACTLFNSRGWQPWPHTRTVCGLP